MDVYVFYHYMHPSEVVSAVQFSELSEDLARLGLKVAAYPCNRTPDGRSKYSPQERRGAVEIRRIWRPAFDTATMRGRVCAAVWMIAAWSLLALRREAPKLLIVGTDPPLALLVAYAWKALRPKTRIVHWCFDLYPDAIAADGMLRGKGLAMRWMRAAMKGAYRMTDVVADIGCCMRRELVRYRPDAEFVTLTPWALCEAPPSAAGSEGEGEAARRPRLSLLYSGNLGRAHSFEAILALARGPHREEVEITFRVKGFRRDELARQLRPEDQNVRLVPFLPQSDLAMQLPESDIHIVSLRSSWTGTVVPSKFFGALAAGRPVLFVGARESSVWTWIETHGVGWCLAEDATEEVVNQLGLRLLEYSRDARQKLEMEMRCWRVYEQHFSRSVVLAKWERVLGSLAKQEERHRPDKCTSIETASID
jgi:glycosyltransferase involved in cell wall biosynthesis